MKKNFTYKGTFTFTLSKVTGLVIIIGALIGGIYLKSETVLISLVTLGASMITIKTIVSNEKAK